MNTAAWPDPDNGLVRTKAAQVTVTAGGSGGSGPSDPSGINVTVRVTGSSGETLYSGSFSMTSADTHGTTVMGALHKTGLSYAYDSISFVHTIAGQQNEGLNGWMFKVNGVAPTVAAIDYALASGDLVEWFYSTDTRNIVGGGGGLLTSPAEQFRDIASAVRQLVLALLQERREALPLETTLNQVVVTGADKPMGKEEKEALQEQLDSNIVSLSVFVDPQEDILISDSMGEIFLQVDRWSLSVSTELTVEEIFAHTLPAAATHTPVSPAYRMGPKGTTFSKPVILSIRLAIPAELDPADLVIAWLDESNGQWYALPTLVDVSNGYISALLNHFTPFAVMARQDIPQLKMFDDVTEESYPWAYTAIHYLANRDIVRGVGEGRFEPARQVTRAEFAAMLVNALGLDAAATGESPFADVGPAAWYAAPVQAAAAAGIVKGISTTAFHPDETITREQMAVMLSRVAMDNDNRTIMSTPFTDGESIALWARDGVNEAVSRNLVRGFPDGTFQPRGLTTRAQAAVVLYRLLGQGQ